MSILIKKLNLKLAERLEPYYFRVVGGYERAQAKKMLKKFRPFAIGITGSCGKTTATKLLSELLDEAYGEDVHQGLGSNTKRWVYRRLRKLKSFGKTWVQEISAGAPDYLDYLLEDIPLDIAVLTTIGADHISSFGSEQAILKEKTKLVTALRYGGVACLNADDAYLADFATTYEGNAKILTYGRHKDAGLCAEVVGADWQSRLRFKLFVDQQEYEVQTRFVGTLMLSSILAALAAIHAKGLPLGPAIAKLSSLEPMLNHMSVHKGDNGQTYLMDAFKSSFWSTRLFAEDVTNMKDGRTIMVIGQISDTGNTGSRAYRQIMRSVAPHCDMIIGVDGAFSAAQKLRSKFDNCEVVPCNDIQEISDILSRQSDALIIVKSGRRTKLWRLWEMANAPIDCFVMPCDIETNCLECPKLRDKS